MRRASREPTGWLEDAPDGPLRELLFDEVLDLLEAEPATWDEEHARRCALRLATVYAWQRLRCEPLARVADALGAPLEASLRRASALGPAALASALREFEGRLAGGGAVGAVLDGVVGVPTELFKAARVACFAAPYERLQFRTSGTTREVRGAHPLATSAYYDAALEGAARRWLLPAAPYRFVLLAPHSDDAPDSSLSYMLARFVARFGDATSRGEGGRAAFFVRDGALVVDAVAAALDEAARDGARVALLGASFGFVHLSDALASDRAWRLVQGSVAMPTGGFKGRSRELSVDELAALVRARFGLERGSMVQEYGMTELCSQGYEAPREGLAPGRYRAPPWLRVDAVDAETLAVLGPGEVGPLRVLDLANVSSCVAVQTADLGVTYPDGSFEVRGRVPGATPRGCARALDAALRGGDGFDE